MGEIPVSQTLIGQFPFFQCTHLKITFPLISLMSANILNKFCSCITTDSRNYSPSFALWVNGNMVIIVPSWRKSEQLLFGLSIFSKAFVLLNILFVCLLRKQIKTINYEILGSIFCIYVRDFLI